MLNIKDFFLRLIGRSTSIAPSTDSLAFIASAKEEMQSQQMQLAAQWKYGKENGWSADLAAGVIAFQFANNYTGTCKFQAIGIYDEQNHCFAWSWGQSSIPAALRDHANLAKEWGRENKHSAFLQKLVKCSMDDAWGYAALSMKLAGANSVYRGRIGHRYIFMTTDEVHIDAPTQITTTPVRNTSSPLNNASPKDPSFAVDSDSMEKIIHLPEQADDATRMSNSQEQQADTAHWAKGRRDFHW